MAGTSARDSEGTSSEVASWLTSRSSSAARCARRRGSAKASFPATKWHTPRLRETTARPGCKPAVGPPWAPPWTPPWAPPPGSTACSAGGEAWRRERAFSRLASACPPRPISKHSSPRLLRATALSLNKPNFESKRAPGSKSPLTATAEPMPAADSACTSGACCCCGGGGCCGGAASALSSMATCLERVWRASSGRPRSRKREASRPSVGASLRESGPCACSFKSRLRRQR
mmetsp:Transcript_44655/g.100813  ORF Transcript_44655/g.100813 Transcript_44655/m.100813 type:complete len:231 (-) Transcript_44655:363-1055(-)